MINCRRSLHEALPSKRLAALRGASNIVFKVGGPSNLATVTSEEKASTGEPPLTWLGTRGTHEHSSMASMWERHDNTHDEKRWAAQCNETHSLTTKRP
eukprot:13340006-Alexandrium_andersonii.AAC.1